MILKAFLLLTCASIIAGEAFAFGGIGFGGSGGGKSNAYKGGVDAIGIHINGKGKADIDIRTCDSETEELVGTECLPKCPDGVERDRYGNCTICKNGYVYLSYMDDPCGTETPMNPPSCTTDGDCWSGCCDENTNLCQADILTDLGSEIICPQADAKSCKSNTDCKTGEFCALLGTEHANYPDTGTCMDIGNVQDYLYNGTYFFGNPELFMTWWSAENWCQAQGKHMVKLVDFGIEEEILGEEGQCFDLDCENVNWPELYNVFGNTMFWIDTERNHNSPLGDEMVIWNDDESAIFSTDMDRADVADYSVLCK